MRNREGAHRLECDICLKKFSTPYTMRRHRTIHSPHFLKHQCDYCPRRFNWLDNLRSHIQGVHGISPQLHHSLLGTQHRRGAPPLL